MISKGYFLAICCFVSFYSCASIESKRETIRVNNNYIILFFPEYSPHSVPIKKQTLIIENIQPTQSTSHIRVDANDVGLITAEFFKNEKSLVMDYVQNRLTRNEKGIWVNYLIEFDDKKQFIKINNTNQKNIATYEYDDAGKLVQSDEKIDGKNYVGIYFYNENGYLIQYQEKEIEIKYPNKEIIFSSVTSYYYDEQQRLISSKSYQEDPILNDTKAQLPKEIYESKYRKSNCYFSQHNEQGDWIVKQCFNGNNELNMSMTRNIIY